MSTQYVIFQATAQTVPYFQSPRARGACFQSPAAILFPPAFIVISLVCFRLVSYLFQKCKNPAHFTCAGFLMLALARHNDEVIVYLVFSLLLFTM